MTVAEFLTEERWGKGAYCRDANGNQKLASQGDDTCKYCVSGAIVKVYGFDSIWDVDARPIVEKLNAAIGNTNTWYRHAIFHWNDNSDYQSVIEAVRRAGI
jgi:hypothetical protein